MALEEREKRMLIALGVVAGLAVLFIVFRMVTGGGGAPTVAPTSAASATEPGATTEPTEPTAGPDSTEGASPTPSVESADGTGTTDTFNISARDIFSPIPVPSLSPSVSPGASPTDGGDFTTGDSVSINGHAIRLDDVIVKRAPLVDVTVDGANYKSGIGDKIAEGFSVQNIDTSTACADFAYKSGSTSDSFTLCVA